MSRDQRRWFDKEFGAQRKNIRNAFLFWFLLSHYGYFGQWSKQILFWLTAGGVGVWWIIDAFRMERAVITYNRGISIQVLGSIETL